MATQRFHATVTRSAGEVTVQLEGEIDLAADAALRTCVDDVVHDRPAAVLVDLTALDFIDVRGLMALGRMAEDVAGAGGTVEVRNPPPVVRKVAELLALDDLLGLHRGPR